MLVLLCLLIMSLDSGAADNDEGWTVYKQLNPDLGSTVVLTCNITSPSFDPFNNPVVWVKVQGEERLEVNLMKVILEPFQKENRFEVAFRGNFTLNPRVYFYWSYGSTSSVGDSYEIILVVKDIRHEDNGRYECQIQGKKSTKILRDIYLVEVLEPVAALHLTTSLNPESFETDEGLPLYELLRRDNSSTEEITARAGKLFSVSCLSFGGNPVPDLLMFLGSLDITGQFALTEKWLNHGVLGFRRKNLIKILQSKSLLVGADDHGLVMVCKAKQDSFEDLVRSTRILVDHPPLLLCQDPKLLAFHSSALPNRFIRGKTCVSCDVKAWPLATSIHWELNRNVSKNQHDFNGLFEVIDPIIQDAEDKLKASVCWRYAISDITNGSDVSAFERVSELYVKHLPTLKLYASNDVGQSEKGINLLAGMKENFKHEDSRHHNWVKDSSFQIYKSTVFYLLNAFFFIFFN